MGMFSQDCVACGHPALSLRATNLINEWMNQIIVITPKGDIHKGEYDGYGCVGSADYAIGYDNTVWHVACWQAAGSPLDYRGISRHSEDQGWFFDDPKHNMQQPRDKAS